MSLFLQWGAKALNVRFYVSVFFWPIIGKIEDKFFILTGPPPRPSQEGAGRGGVEPGLTSTSSAVCPRSLL